MSRLRIVAFPPITTFLEKKKKQQQKLDPPFKTTRPLYEFHPFPSNCLCLESNRSLDPRPFLSPGPALNPKLPRPLIDSFIISWCGSLFSRRSLLWKFRFCFGTKSMRCSSLAPLNGLERLGVPCSLRSNTGEFLSLFCSNSAFHSLFRSNSAILLFRSKTGECPLFCLS